MAVWPSVAAELYNEWRSSLHYTRAKVAGTLRVPSAGARFRAGSRRTAHGVCLLLWPITKGIPHGNRHSRCAGAPLEHAASGAGLVREIYDAFLLRSPRTKEFEERLLAETGTRLLDWVDHFEISER